MQAPKDGRINNSVDFYETSSSGSSFFPKVTVYGLPLIKKRSKGCTTLSLSQDAADSIISICMYCLGCLLNDKLLFDIGGHAPDIFYIVVNTNDHAIQSVPEKSDG